MIGYIREKTKAYFEKESKLNIVLNFLFFTLLLLLLIPSTRREVLPRIQRLMMFSPNTVAESEQKALSGKDFAYQYKDKKGEMHTLSDLRGEVIFLNIWATWCPPCVAEMPSIQALYNDYKDKVRFVFLTEEGQEKVDPFLQKHKFDLPVYQMIFRLPENLATKSIPATYVISRDGKLAIQKVGIADWNSDNVRETIDKLLDNK